ncbi:hypothetical protein UFOVP998_28 [uncultured Caudovirales phage]|uniref:Uncharacterized protein n=1 Tax=uncultured Caudovirales phage TaxID=2100421 RepID=A0A6J5SG39_9CAUD|nr:hypothetical protein UFOVP998_28 [uncultured Caudovirales phage]CAB4199247.1 hypothetical protein UFOVP1331_31 [uncultured Caudovirales phage]CAB4213019.1 hypothetical protein UFOVP1442_44 [uncultured Caudovirales phage]CAB5227950.1 hypothetical protein UFOVP1535_7 [uncultured Caudovirales phage]
MRWWDWLLFWRPPAMLRTCVVNLKDLNRDGQQQAIRGVLWRSRGPWLTLRQCQALVAEQPAQPIDGEVLVHRSNVSFLQVLP